MQAVSASPLRILRSPLAFARALPERPRVRPAAGMILTFAVLMAAAMFVSYLNHDYPPAPDILKIWIANWGEFNMTPFLKIPMESYRLFLAIIIVPLALAMWMLMAGTAKLLSLLFGGRGTYEQYLLLTAFSFFPFWILAGVMDTIFSGVIDGYVLQAITGQMGGFAGAFWRAFPAFFYVALYSLGGVYIGLTAAGLERFAWWKAVLTALLSFAWPMLLMSALMR